jgi:hypothetical protein
MLSHPKITIGSSGPWSGRSERANHPVPAFLEPPVGDWNEIRGYRYKQDAKVVFSHGRVAHPFSLL